MALVGKIFKSAIEINRKLSITRKSIKELQEQTLRKLLKSASRTDFGRHYDFEGILHSPNMVQAYQAQVPFFDYDRMHKEWWYRSIQGEKDVSWGKSNSARFPLDR